MIKNTIRRILDFIGILPGKSPLVRVVEKIEFTPSIMQITFEGKFETLNLTPGAYLSFKLNYTQTRKYTLAAVDSAKGIFQCIVYLHNNQGVGRHLMKELRIGDTLSVNSLRANSNYLNLQTRKFVFFGDETSLGLALSLLAKWRNQACDFLFLFELDSENKEVPLQLGFNNMHVYDKKKNLSQ